MNGEVKYMTVNKNALRKHLKAHIQFFIIQVYKCKVKEIKPIYKAIINNKYIP